MSAIPFLRQQTVDTPRIRVAPGVRRAAMPRLFSRCVAFFGVAAGVYLASAMMGSVALEVGRQGSISSREQAETMRSRQAFLRHEVSAMNRMITQNQRRIALAAADVKP